MQNTVIGKKYGRRTIMSDSEYNNTYTNLCKHDKRKADMFAKLYISEDDYYKTIVRKTIERETLGKHKTYEPKISKDKKDSYQIDQIIEKKRHELYDHNNSIGTVKINHNWGIYTLPAQGVFSLKIVDLFDEMDSNFNKNTVYECEVIGYESRQNELIRSWDVLGMIMYIK